MASMTAVELPTNPAADPAEDAEGDAVNLAIVALGSWMAALGAIRLVCAIADYATSYRQAPGSGLGGAWAWSAFFWEHPPLFVLIGAWPLALGLMVRRTRWRELVKVGALTFLVLSIGGVLMATADWGRHRNLSIAIGSFPVSRIALMRLETGGVTLVLAGALQLLLELGVALRAIVLAFRGPDGIAMTADRDVVIRRRLGRLALVASIVFLAMTIRVPAWSTYLDVLFQSRMLREVFLRPDTARMKSTRRAPAPAPESQPIRDGQALFNEAIEAASEGQYGKARDSYLRLVDLLETIPLTSLNPSERQFAAQGLNNAAWLMATCPDLEVRDHPDAVKHARRARDLEPNDGNIWNTLGVAYFRLGNWEEAISALYRSMELRNEGDSFDWFFLSMIHARLGRTERAREWYDKAVQWSQRHRPGDPELYQFQAEAAEVLGLPKPERPATRPMRTNRPPVNTRGFRMRGRSVLVSPRMAPG